MNNYRGYSGPCQLFGVAPTGLDSFALPRDMFGRGAFLVRRPRLFEYPANRSRRDHVALFVKGSGFLVANRFQRGNSFEVIPGSVPVHASGIRATFRQQSRFSVRG